MQRTSHFIWIKLRAELLSNIFIEVYKYIKENNIENSIFFQNPLSPHITLYYLEKDIDNNTKDEIKSHIQNFNTDEKISLSWFNYFFKWEWNRFILYFTSKTDLPLENYRNNLHKKYNRNYIEDNNFCFFPSYNFFKNTK